MSEYEFRYVVPGRTHDPVREPPILQFRAITYSETIGGRTQYSDWETVPTIVGNEEYDIAHT